MRGGFLTNQTEPDYCVWINLDIDASMDGLDVVGLSTPELALSVAS